LKCGAAGDKSLEEAEADLGVRVQNESFCRCKNQHSI
jgi:hypothetical protein